MLPTNKVLIIDDESDICFLLSSILKNSGYSVEYANTLSEGLLKFNSTNPDIILLDVNLPDGCGLDYVSVIKEKKIDTKLIVMSAHVSYSEVKDVLGKGADSFIPKPITKKELMYALNRET
jgi:two-component system OmpR family response regulator